MQNFILNDGVYLIGEWAKVSSAETLIKALSCCKGIYQRNLVMGKEALSGSTLRGKAREYGAGYARSRKALLSRMTASGLRITEERAQNNKRVLVIG